MEGGDLIGQGTYGCVFDPPLLCKEARDHRTKRKSRIVGKISQAIDVDNELDASKALSSVPNSNLYFVLPVAESYCKPKVAHLQPDKSIKKCEAIQRYGEEGMVHFLMPYGGISIRPYISLHPNTPVLHVHSFVKRLLEATATLNLRGYIHYDIHLGNILVNEKTHLPRLIDFGMSFSSNEITKETLDDLWKQYVPASGPEPPEITVISGIRHGFSFKKVLTDVYSKKTPLKTVETLFGLSRKQQANKFIAFWKSSNVVKEKDWVRFFQLYWPAFDAWGIGYVILHIYKYALASKEAATQPKITDTLDKTKEVIKGLLRMDPRSRLDCIEALQLFDPENAIVESAAGKVWLTEKDEIRAAMAK